MTGQINTHVSDDQAQHAEPSGRIDRQHGSAAPPTRVAAIDLTEAERLRLRRAAAELATVSPVETAEAFCLGAEVELKSAGLDRVIRTLRTAFAAGTPEGTFVVNGLPTDDPPPTPPDNTRHLGETTELARCQAVLNHALGYMIAYEAEGAGRLFQDMVPSKGMEYTQTSLGFGAELEVHTEQAFSALRPDVLSLAALRGDAQAKTYSMTARTLLEHLSPNERELVRQPRWTTGVDASFRAGGHRFIHGNVRGPVPIIAGPLDDPTLVFDQDLMEGVSDESQRLVRRVVDIYRATRSEHVLRPGELLLIDNHRAIHGRSTFTPRFDGRDRFIVRSFVVRDLSASSHARDAGSRAIQARYS